MADLLMKGASALAPTGAQSKIVIDQPATQLDCLLAIDDAVKAMQSATCQDCVKLLLCDA